MKEYKKTTVEELTNIIKEKGAESISGKYFNLSGIPRGIFSKKIAIDEAFISYTLDDKTGPLALITYYVPTYKDGSIISFLKTANEMNEKIFINGLLRASGSSINRENPQIYILQDGLSFRKFKHGSLEDKTE